MNKMATLATKH